ncbi:hypothetical protein TRAPUB_11936 [Trametes pubescens]|uniref:Uncharacterized protein n=1 Tax=Trametes pubescens TaxID=154538 RepID=A0A1M2VVC3_TRAPU|nr:hypothetical protein TRAPUB_11936 [Trametes pubescens]
MSDAVRKFKATLPRLPRKGKGRGKDTANKTADDASCDIDSPDKVDNRQWATGRKLAYVTSYLEAWREANELENVSDFYDNVTVRWIAMWGWNLPAETDAPPDVEDPSAAAMEAIFKTTEESQVTEEAQRRREYFWQLRGRLARWFRYHGRKSLKHNKSDPVAKVISSFANMSAKPPKRHSRIQFYQRTYYDTRIKASVDAEFNRLCKEAVASNRDAPQHVAVSNAVAARLYAAESAPFKAQMLKDLEADFQQRLAKHKLLTGQNKVPSTAMEYHDELEASGHWLNAFAEHVSRRTGMNVTILLAGPIGENGGEIGVRCVNAGKSNTLVPKVWPEFDEPTFNLVSKSMVGFAHACFTPEECQARALPSAALAQASNATSPSPAASPAPAPQSSSVPSPAASPAPAPHSSGVPSPAASPAPAPRSLSVPATAGAPASVSSEPPNTSTPTAPETAQYGYPRGAPARGNSRHGSMPPASFDIEEILFESLDVRSLSAPPIESAAFARPPEQVNTVEASADNLPSSSRPSPSDVPSPEVVTSPETELRPPLVGATTSPSLSLPPAARLSVHLAPSPAASSAPCLARPSAIDASDCPEDMQRLVRYLRGDGGWGLCWHDLVATYVAIERRRAFKAQGRLPKATESRPSEVAVWMKHARPLVDFQIANVGTFAGQWLLWWQANQPATRRKGLSRNVVGIDWSQLAVTGPSGLLLFLITSAWWGAAVQEADTYHQQAWLDAVEDMAFVFKHVLHSLECGSSQGAQTIRSDFLCPMQLGD